MEDCICKRCGADFNKVGVSSVDRMGLVDTPLEWVPKTTEIFAAHGINIANANIPLNQIARIDFCPTCFTPLFTEVLLKPVDEYYGYCDSPWKCSNLLTKEDWEREGEHLLCTECHEDE